MENLRKANTEPSMHFRETNTDPSMHFRKANTDPSMHFRKANMGFCSLFYYHFQIYFRFTASLNPNITTNMLHNDKCNVVCFCK